MVAVFSEQYSDKGKDLSDLTNLGIMLTYTGITLSSDHELKMLNKYLQSLT